MPEAEHPTAEKNSNLPPAAHDRTTVTGLAAFARAHPGDWDYQLRHAQPELPEELLSMTVASALRTELAQQLGPRHPKDLNRVRRYRASARRLVDVAGDELMSDVDEPFLGIIEDRLTRRYSSALGRSLAADSVSRDVGLMRKVAFRWACAAAVEPQVSEKAPSRAHRRRTAPTSRRPPTVQEFFELLLVSGPALRAAMGLAVGGGLGHGEIRQLQQGQVDPRAHGVQVWGRGHGGQLGHRGVRLVWLPGWAWELVQPVVLDWVGKSVAVFPSRYDLHQGRGDFNKPLQKACEAAFGPSGARYTMEDLRALWQAVARAQQLPRAVVRGSWSMPQNGTPPAGALKAKKMAQEWDELFGGPGAAEVFDAVPRRAGSGVGPWEPEVVAVESDELPDSCTPSAPPKRAAL